MVVMVMFNLMLHLQRHSLLLIYLYCVSVSILWFQESKINVGVRSIFCVVQKAEGEWWKRLLRGEGKTPHYVKVDWDKWVDEDEDEGIHVYDHVLPMFFIVLLNIMKLLFYALNLIELP